jgi:hypothetical protein
MAPNVIITINITIYIYIYIYIYIFTWKVSKGRIDNYDLRVIQFCFIKQRHSNGSHEW